MLWPSDVAVRSPSSRRNPRADAVGLYRVVPLRVDEVAASPSLVRLESRRARLDESAPSAGADGDTARIVRRENVGRGRPFTARCDPRDPGTRAADVCANSRRRSNHCCHPYSQSCARPSSRAGSATPEAPVRSTRLAYRRVLRRAGRCPRSAERQRRLDRCGDVPRQLLGDSSPRARGRGNPRRALARSLFDARRHAFLGERSITAVDFRPSTNSRNETDPIETARASRRSRNGNPSGVIAPDVERATSTFRMVIRRSVCCARCDSPSSTAAGRSHLVEQSRTRARDLVNDDEGSRRASGPGIEAAAAREGIDRR